MALFSNFSPMGPRLAPAAPIFALRIAFFMP